MNGYTIIDVDTHVTEAPDLWTSRVPTWMRDSVPRIDTDADGRLWWYIGNQRIANPGLTATAGVGDMKNWPKTYDDIIPAHSTLMSVSSTWTAWASGPWSCIPTSRALAASGSSRSMTPRSS